MPVEPIPFQPRRFRGAAAHYLAGRPAYPARLIDRALSMSSTAPERLGGKAADMVAEIEALLARLAPDGRLNEVIAGTAFIARRPA
jgi:hypothetical protein